MTRRWPVRMVGLIAFILFPLVYPGCHDYDGAPPQFSPPTPPTQSKYVLAANTDADSISVFRIESDGSLTSIDNVVLAPGSAPTMIALHPNGQFLYVLNSAAKNDSWSHKASIGVYTFNSSTGAIAEVEGSPFTIPPYGEGLFTGMYYNMAITPDGKFLYVTDPDTGAIGQVHLFDVSGNGALSYVDSFDTDAPRGIAMHPSGKFLFVGSNNGPIGSFAIGADGSLTEAPGSPLSLNGNYVGLEVTPDGKFLYGAGNGYLAIAGINADDGALSLIDNLNLADLELSGMKTVKVTPDGKYIYPAFWGNNNVLAAFIQSDGSFQPVNDNPFYDVGTQPRSVTVTRDSGMLYVANYGSNDVTAYKILADGSLGNPVTYPLPDGAGPKFIVALP